jgi:hypothetical protein
VFISYWLNSPYQQQFGRKEFCRIFCALFRLGYFYVKAIIKYANDENRKAVDVNRLNEKSLLEVQVKDKKIWHGEKEGYY